MDRFVSNTINRVDKKGRVSIPASFRLVLGDQPVLHTILSVDHPVAEAGGIAFQKSNERRLSQMDPFSEEYEMWSFCLEGDADQLKIDSEGRIALSDNIREHTGISDAVAFVGRGNFFQLWEPGAFRAYREVARTRVREMRRNLGQAGFKSNSPASQAGPSTHGTLPAAGPGTQGPAGSGEEQGT